MKAITTLTLILLMTVATAWSDDSPTLTFDQSQVTCAPERGLISYGSYKATAVGMSLQLPSREYYIEFPETETLPTLSWQVIDRRRMTVDIPLNALDDLPTANAVSSYEAAMANREKATLGAEPVYIIDRISCGDRRWLKILVFPVTVNQQGECQLNRSLIISLNSVPLKASDLKTTIESQLEPETKTSAELSVASEPAADYLIVTSATLSEPVAQLAMYKNATGIVTIVEIIDDILPGYTGRDDAEKLRERLKDFHANGGSFVLLAGDETQLPIRYAYPYSTSSQPTINNQQICDLYFADLTGEWDFDNDGVWGEKYVDQADLTPELAVGRLPLNTTEEMANYVAKLIIYETNPGDGNTEYLKRAFFFSSDQMRDYAAGGQHGRIAAAYPENITIDTAHGVELSRGDDPSPTNASAGDLESVLSDGYGIVNVIAHGDQHAFGVRTTNYNEWPKSYFVSEGDASTDGNFHDLQPNNRISFYYSLACDNGGFDMDQPPFNAIATNLVQCILGLQGAGAVGFVANSRWGWISSSYLLQKAFFDSLFANPERPAVEALYDAKAVYSYYRDQVLGLNYFGDPTLKVYTGEPGILDVSAEPQGANQIVDVLAGQIPVSGCQVILSQDGVVLYSGTTGNDGRATINYDVDPDEEYALVAIKTGYATYQTSYKVSLETAVEDDVALLPDQFRLAQNYPNPFNPSTTIQFKLASESHVRLIVYNLLGQTVAVLKNEILSAGQHHVEWNSTDDSGDDVASGMYLYRLECDSFTAVKKMVLLR